MKIKRELTDIILKHQLGQGKVIIIYGARRTGKTTLTKDIQDQLNLSTLYLNCDLDQDLDSLSSKSVEAQANVWKNNKLIIIDEAQRKKNIGLILKIAIDNFKDKNFIVTGSSSLELANEVVEPLTGRKYTNKLYPLALKELASEFNKEVVRNNLQDYLTWGLYPEVCSITSQTEKIDYLLSISNDYLYKDILEYSDIRKPDILPKLLKLLAYQLGNEVSHHELSKTLNIDQQTVFKYLDLLEKSFVIFRLPAFSKNLRSEINTKEKIYFCDLGIRNAVINDFNDINIRQDKGALFENLVILERFKKLHYEQVSHRSFFWRTHTRQEVDYVEQKPQGPLQAFEIKYNKLKTKPTKLWKETYPDSNWSSLNKDNFMDFCL